MIEEGEDVAILFVRLQKVVHLLLAGKNRHCPEPSRCNRTGGIGKPYCIPNFLLCPLLNGLGTFKNSRGNVPVNESPQPVVSTTLTVKAGTSTIAFPLLQRTFLFPSVTAMSRMEYVSKSCLNPSSRESEPVKSCNSSRIF